MIVTSSDEMTEAGSVEESNRSDGRRRDEDDEDDGARFTKAKRHDIQLPIADADIKLADKLDSILKLGTSRKPRFYTYKPKNHGQNQDAPVAGRVAQADDTPGRRMQRRNLTKQELEERLAKHYDTLIPEIDKNCPVVKVLKVLSVTESMKLAEDVAKKQLAQDFELSSVSGNRLAHQKGIGAFRFRDDYDELSKKDMFDATKKEQSPPPKCPEESTSLTVQKESKKPDAQCQKKTVRFSNVEDHSDGVLVLGNRYGDFFDSDDDDISDHSDDRSSVDSDEEEDNG